MKKVTLLDLKLHTLLEGESSLSAYRYVSTLPKTKRDRVDSYPDALTALFRLLGGEGALPLAALQAHRYRLTPSAHWLLADPIECQADHRTVYCLGNAHLAITQQEATELLDTLNAHLKDEGLHVYCLTPERWLMAMDKPFNIDTKPLSQVLNQDIAAFEPTLWPKEWKRLFVELEMLLHQHPVNQARHKKGHPKISACWFWGGGELALMPAQPQLTVLSDDPLVRTLAEWVNAQTAALPTDYATAKALCEKETQHLLIVTQTESLSTFDQHWLGPVMEAMKAKQVEHLAIYAGDNICYDVVTQNKRIKLPFF